jgi:hypothetical protein
MSGKTMRIEQPLVIMFEAPDHKIVCHVHPSKTVNRHEHYGFLICDLVRQVSRAFNVGEDDVWEWVDRERRAPTSPIERPS